jgi:hypothetical protein
MKKCKNIKQYLHPKFVCHSRVIAKYLLTFCLLEDFYFCQQLDCDDLKGVVIFHFGRIFSTPKEYFYNHKIVSMNDPTINVIVVFINNNYNIEFIFISSSICLDISFDMKFSTSWL